MARGVAAVPLFVRNIVPSYVATPMGPPGAAPPTPIPLPTAVWPNTPLSVVMLPAAVTCAKVGVVPPVPLAAAVMRPWASTVMLALVYEPAVTVVAAKLIVPDVVIVPPFKPVPAVMLVTVPEPEPEGVAHVPSLRKKVVVEPVGAGIA